MTTATRDGTRLAATWRLLSLGFTPPTEELLDEVEALAEALDHVAVRDAIRAAPVAEHAAQFAALFRGTVLVAPYEGSYEIDPIRQGRQMADVAAFYRAFGAEAHGPIPERPDFVSCELEFLAYLELRRLSALESGEDDAQLVDEIGDAFLEDHAGRWLPTFFATVRDEAPSASLYRALAELGAAVVEDEIARRGVEPSTLPRRHARSGVEADALECGGAAQIRPR